MPRKLKRNLSSITTGSSRTPKKQQQQPKAKKRKIGSLNSRKKNPSNKTKKVSKKTVKVQKASKGKKNTKKSENKQGQVKTVVTETKANMKQEMEMVNVKFDQNEWSIKAFEEQTKKNKNETGYFGKKTTPNSNT